MNKYIPEDVPTPCGVVRFNVSWGDCIPTVVVLRDERIVVAYRFPTKFFETAFNPEQQRAMRAFCWRWLGAL